MTETRTTTTTMEKLWNNSVNDNVVAAPTDITKYTENVDRKIVHVAAGWCRNARAYNNIQVKSCAEIHEGKSKELLAAAVDAATHRISGKQFYPELKPHGTLNELLIK